MTVPIAEEDGPAQKVGNDEGPTVAKNETEGGSAEAKKPDNSETLMEELLTVNE